MSIKRDSMKYSPIDRINGNRLPEIFAAARRKYGAMEFSYIGAANGLLYLQVWGDKTEYTVTEKEAF